MILVNDLAFNEKKKKSAENIKPKTPINEC